MREPTINVIIMNPNTGKFQELQYTRADLEDDDDVPGYLMDELFSMFEDDEDD